MFGQNQKKEIIVVTPDKYKNVARQMVHELSKLKNCNVAVWSIKQFEDNEFQIGSSHWVLSIGNLKENKLTSAYSKFINLIHEKGGLCYGYDSNKAILFADPDKLDSKETIEVAKKLGLLTGAGVAVGGITAPLVAAGTIFAWLIMPPTVLSVIMKKKKEAELVKTSTSLTADLFLKDGVNNWLDIQKENDSE